MRRNILCCLLVGGCLCAGSCKRQEQPAVTVVHVDMAAWDPRVRVVPGKPGQTIAPKVNEEDPYQATIRAYLDREEFDHLEEEAHQARVGKIRFTGGTWKLFSFYTALTNLPDGEPADEAGWNARLQKLKDWVTAKPESVTAQIALADAFINYGWYGRGSGYSNTVRPEQWLSFEQRTDLARAILKKAAQLSEKCPYWYQAMQNVALAQGWKKSEARELLEQAIAFEPGYYQFYREYARYLEPHMYGTEGEAEAFAEEVSTRLGGQEGAHVYFEIGSLLACQCSGGALHMKRLSWPKLQEGYEAMEQLYGVSSLKRSRFAHMAYLASDWVMTRKLLLEVGDNWDLQTWRTKEHFEEVRDWAVGPEPNAGEPADSLFYAGSNPRTGTSLSVGDQVSFSVTVGYDLQTADTGNIVLVLQKDSGAPLGPAQRQVRAVINRGSGEATFTDSFEVPSGTKKIHVFLPLAPAGNTLTSNNLRFDYPVVQK